MTGIFSLLNSEQSDYSPSNEEGKEEYIVIENDETEEELLDENEEMLTMFFSNEEHSVYIWVISDLHVVLEKNGREFFEGAIDYVFNVSRRYSGQSCHDFSVLLMGDVGAIRHFDDKRSLFWRFIEHGWKFIPVYGNHDGGKAYIDRKKISDMKLLSNVTGIDLKYLFEPLYSDYVFPLYDDLGIVVTSHRSIPNIQKVFKITRKQSSKKNDTMRKNLLIGHISPTSRWFLAREEFFKLVDANSDILVDMGFYGHEHTHYFYNQRSKNTNFTHMVLPSFNTRYSGPGLSLIKYSRKKRVVEDLMIFSSSYFNKKNITENHNTSPSNSSSLHQSMVDIMRDSWSPVLSYSQRYSKPDLRAIHMKEIAEEIITTSPTNTSSSLLENDDELGWYTRNAHTLNYYQLLEEEQGSGSEKTEHPECMQYLDFRSLRQLAYMEKSLCKKWVKCKIETYVGRTFDECFFLNITKYKNM